MRERHHCLECGKIQLLELRGWTEIGRPSWICPRGHTQAGPFPDRDPAAADGGRDR